MKAAIGTKSKSRKTERIDMIHKTVLITGGAQGIGKGITRHLLQLGMSVVMADIDAEAGEETANEYQSRGNIFFCKTDTAKESEIQNAIRFTLEKVGELDALVNNAGIAQPFTAPVEQLSLSDWNRILQTNLTGYFLCAKHAIPSLRKQKGAIVNIASTRALQSQPHSEAYAASKGGIVALSHALAVSVGPDIRINCISPGWIETSRWQKERNKKPLKLSSEDHSQHPVGRVGDPHDIAAMVAFLISDEAGFITGQNFVVDGGMTKKMIYTE
jgi:NAD(P)-dependent dehydrogenase (short-subunit alcohol dehydrogenase family)